MIRTRQGFTLIELLIVVAIIGIIAGVAIPGLMRARMAGNEASAIGSMRAINSGQAAYASSAARGGYATSLTILGAACPSSPAGFVSPDIGTSDPIDKSGYRLSVGAGTGAAPGPTDCNNAPSQSTYYVKAIPVTLESTGHRSFASNQAATIYVLTGGAAPTEVQFVQVNALQ